MRLCYLSFLVALLGSLFLSLGDSFAAGADTAAAEQVIRIQMKMGIVGARVQAWLAAGGTPQQVEALSQSVGTYLNSGQLANAEAAMDSLFNIIVGASAPSEAAEIAADATRIVGLHPLIERWAAAGGDLNQVMPLWAALSGSLFSGSLTDVETQIDRIEAFVAIPALCGTMSPPPPSTTQSPTLIGTLVTTNKNTTPGPDGFHYLMDLVTSAGVNLYLLGGNWAHLEPSPGTFDFGGSLVQPLNDITARYPQFAGFGFIINVLNGGSRLMPADLLALPFDDPGVLARFDALIDALAAQPASAKLGFILVGNELDSMLTDPAAVAAFVTFYQRAVTRIHLKLPNVKVSAIISAGGATGRTPKLFADVSAVSDFVTYTYYPTAGSTTGTWVMRPPSEVKPDLDWLAALACGKPFAFTEIGYASSVDNGSSESQQADFVRTVFADLDTYRQQGRLAFLQYQSLYDLPPDACNAYTIQNNAVADSICTFLRSLGLRSWDTDIPRQAWDAFVAGIGQWSR
jgi:hypothetical protein